MRKRMITGLAAAAGVAAAYAVPAPKRAFDDLYAGVAGPTRDSLAEFRAHHVPDVIDAGGVVWRYVSLGEGTQAVLLLHGMGGAHDIWWQQIEALAEDYRVIAVTYPAVERLERLAAGVDAVLHTENVEAAHVVGTSLGGYLAQYLVATRPERVASAVFANTFPPNDVLRKEHRARVVLGQVLPEWAVMRSFAGNIRDAIVPAAGGHPLVEAYLLEQAYGGMTKRDLAARYRCVIDDFTAPAPRMPVLLIQTDNDPLVSEQLRGMLRGTYPEAKVASLGEVGHFPYLNTPDAYTATLREFLPEAAGRGGG